MSVGDVGRDDGIATVLGNTGDAWKCAYRKHVNEWFVMLGIGQVFNGERLRKHVESTGLEPPGHHNAWGGMASGVIGHWLKTGRIEQLGPVSKALDAQAHSRRYPTYRKLR